MRAPFNRYVQIHQIDVENSRSKAKTGVEADVRIQLINKYFQ